MAHTGNLAYYGFGDEASGPELYQVLAKRIVVENVVRWKNKSGMPGL